MGIVTIATDIAAGQLKLLRHCLRLRLSLLLIFYIMLFSNNYWIVQVSTNPIGKSGTKALFNESEVFLTVRAIAGVDSNGEFLDRQLELNWYNLPSSQQSNGAAGWIGLFDYDPSSKLASNQSMMARNRNIKQNENALFKVNTTGIEHGNVNSSIRFERIEYNFSKNNVNERFNTINDGGGICIGYWIAYFEQIDSEFPSITNCLKLYPTWMNNLKEFIGDRPLSSIMIPGTHNAGAWKYYAGRSDDLNAVIQYTYNQEDSIYSQLQHGIRYLDVRVGYQAGTTEKFWIYHSLRIRPLITLLEEVKRFCEETNEIILMDFHRFVEGFDGQNGQAVHNELLQFVMNYTGDLLISKSSVGLNPSANKIWETNTNILWAYANDEMSNSNDLLWPYLRHAWGDKNDVVELRQYLGSTAIPAYGCRNSLWSAMAELTPTTQDIILRPLFGLRKFAQLVNIPLTDWYRDPNWYTRSNIVSTDFYLGNNIIEMSILVNKNKASCP